MSLQNCKEKMGRFGSNLEGGGRGGRRLRWEGKKARKHAKEDGLCLVAKSSCCREGCVRGHCGGEIGGVRETGAGRGRGAERCRDRDDESAGGSGAAS
jgi:hypothetical protein